MRSEENEGLLPLYRIPDHLEARPTPQIAEKKARGTLTLTAQEVAGLDALLEFFRGKKSVGSTTTVSLIVECHEAGRLVAVENLFDGSGGHGLDSRKDVTTFYALANRLGGNAR